jgi:peptide/nickel transport system substrate-binding protein
MLRNRFASLTERQKEAIAKDLEEAYDFEPRDPLFGLSKTQLSGPRLERRAVLRLMAAAGTLTAAQLVPALAAPRPASAQERGGTLEGGWSGVSEIRTLDPARIDQVEQFQITSNVLSGLTHINGEFVAQPDLAADWVVSDDGTEYTFNLREGVTFHNGDPFTADDVVFTYRRSKDPAQSIHTQVLVNVVDVEKVDPLTVRFKLARPQASFLVKTTERASGRAMTIVNRRALEELGAAQYGLTPVGTGPFRVVEHTLGQPVRLEAFENYYDPARPKLERVNINPIVEAEPLAAALEAGDVQIVGGAPVPAELIERFQANPDIVVDMAPRPGFYAIYMNPWRDPMRVADFNKPLEELLKEPGFQVRAALARALDRDRFIEIGNLGFGTPSFGSVNPALVAMYDPAIAEKSEQRYQPDSARELLAAAGYPDGEGLRPLVFTLIADERRRGQVFADIMRRELGVEIQLDAVDVTVVGERRDRLDFDLLIQNSGGDFDPDDGLVDFMTTDSKFNANARDKAKYPFGYFSEAEVDRLVAEQSVTPDPARRRELVQQANLLTSNKVAAMFVFHPVSPLVTRKEVNFPAESRIPDLVDLDLVTVST